MAADALKERQVSVGVFAQSNKKHPLCLKPPLLLRRQKWSYLVMSACWLLEHLYNFTTKAAAKGNLEECFDAGPPKAVCGPQAFVVFEPTHPYIHTYIPSLLPTRSHTAAATGSKSAWGQVWFHQGGQEGFLGQPHWGPILKLASMVTLKANPGLLKMHGKKAVKSSPGGGSGWTGWKGEPVSLIASTWDTERSSYSTRRGVCVRVQALCVCLNSNIPVLSSWLN